MPFFGCIFPIIFFHRFWQSFLEVSKWPKHDSSRVPFEYLQSILEASEASKNGPTQVTFFRQDIFIKPRKGCFAYVSFHPGKWTLKFCSDLFLESLFFISEVFFYIAEAQAEIILQVPFSERQFFGLIFSITFFIDFRDYFCKLRRSGKWSVQGLNFLGTIFLIISFLTLRESISRGYPFFFVRKGHKYFFYSVLFIHLSPYLQID